MPTSILLFFFILYFPVELVVMPVNVVSVHHARRHSEIRAFFMWLFRPADTAKQSIQWVNEGPNKKQKKKQKTKTKLHATTNVYNCLMNSSQNKAHATSTSKFQLTVRSDRCYFSVSLSSDSALVTLALFQSEVEREKLFVRDDFQRKTKTNYNYINTIHQLCKRVSCRIYTCKYKRCSIVDARWQKPRENCFNFFLSEQICKCIYLLTQYVKKLSSCKSMPEKCKYHSVWRWYSEAFFMSYKMFHFYHHNSEVYQVFINFGFFFLLLWTRNLLVFWLSLSS